MIAIYHLLFNIIQPWKRHWCLHTRENWSSFCCEIFYLLTVGIFQVKADTNGRVNHAFTLIKNLNSELNVGHLKAQTVSSPKDQCGQTIDRVCDTFHFYHRNENLKDIKIKFFLYTNKSKPCHRINPKILLIKIFKPPGLPCVIMGIMKKRIPSILCPIPLYAV